MEDITETASTDRFVNYLPATVQPSQRVGRVERFVTRLFRRRGGLRVVVRE